MVVTTERGQQEGPLARLRRRYADRQTRGGRKAGEPLTKNSVAPTGTLRRLQERYLPPEGQTEDNKTPEA